MIDLQKLEAQIDELLASETQDSLLSWLMEHRISNLRQRMGTGVFVPLSDLYSQKIRIHQSEQVKVQPNYEVEYQDDPTCNLYANAA